MNETRSARDPAEDIMPKLIVACEEAGLVVHRRCTSDQHLEDGDFRIIEVSTSPPGVSVQQTHPDLCSVIQIETTVGVDGQWSRRVGIRSAIQDKDNAIMHGRTIPVVEGMTWEEHPGVALSDLAAELMDVVKERSLVQEALARGEQGPWRFPRSTWMTSMVWGCAMLGSVEFFSQV
jgi:hypothetical protein